MISKNKKLEENWIVKNERGEISFKFVQELRLSQSSCTLKVIDLAKREGIIIVQARITTKNVFLIIKRTQNGNSSYLL